MGKGKAHPIASIGSGSANTTRVPRRRPRATRGVEQLRQGLAPGAPGVREMTRGVVAGAQDEDED